MLLEVPSAAWVNALQDGLPPGLRVRLSRCVRGACANGLWMSPCCSPLDADELAVVKTSRETCVVAFPLEALGEGMCPGVALAAVWPGVRGEP